MKYFFLASQVYSSFTKLKNDASICSQNSVLQCLLTSPVAAAVVAGSGPVAHALRSLHDRMLSTEATDADDLRAAMAGDGIQDSLEYLTALRGAQQGGLAEVTGLTSEERLTCMTCGTVKQTPGKLGEISIHLNAEDIDLQREIDQLVAEEPVVAECEFCGGDLAMKAARITNAPGMLVIHLVRSTFDQETLKQVKLMKHVDCPLTELRFSGTTYDLHGTVEHLGTEPEGGHFTAHVRDKTSSEWFDVDDEKIQAINAGDVVTSNSYLLFYVKRA